MATSGNKPIVLVTGGTGKQGGATIRHLLERGRVRVRALSRDPDSAQARHLAAQGVEWVRGSFDDPDSLRRALAGVSAAYSVQTMTGKGGVAAEERQGKAFADAVKAVGTPLLVYSSVEGAERSSGVPHFESKWRIEQHIRALGLNATILRPVAFMENFTGPKIAKSMTLGMFKAVLGTSKPVQLVSTADIGWFAAGALEDPGSFAGRTIRIAGDELTVPEISAAYDNVTGRPLRAAPLPHFLPRLMLPRDLSLMFYWIGEHGFEADVVALRREYPRLLTFEAWLKQAEWNSNNATSIGEHKTSI